MTDTSTTQQQSSQISSLFKQYLASDDNGGVGTDPGSTTFQQATLTIDGIDVQLNVNPTKVKLKKTQNTHASQTNRQAPSGQNSAQGGFQTTMVGQTQYKGSTPGTLTIEGAVLGSADGATGIDTNIATLTSALVPKANDDSTSTPPIVVFKWGQWRPLAAAYLSNLEIHVTDWLVDGTPVRADLPTLVLTEAPQTDSGQNPTSGAFGSRRTHTVIAGDSLASISYAVYGRPDYWRAIADVNGIDDPLRLRTGTELLIPPREYAKGNK
jgi:nucleoid-associated protein YgaU